MIDKDALIVEYKGFADSLAVREWQKAPYALDLDTLKAQGYLGLVEAAHRWESYCLEKGYDSEALQFFKVFAGKRIYGSIRDSIRSDDWATRTVRAKSRILKDNGLLDGASIEELVTRTSMKEKDVRKTILRMMAKPVSLDVATEVSNPKASIDASFFSTKILNVFAEELKKRPLAEQLVVVLIHYMGYTNFMISEELGISEEEVSSVYENALIFVIQSLREAAKTHMS